MRSGHIGVRRLSKSVNHDLIENLILDNYLIFESYIQGKMKKTPFLGVGHRVRDLLELIDSDVCGPLNHAAHDGSTFIVIFTDDMYKYGYVYLIRHISEIFDKFKIFRNEVEKKPVNSSSALDQIEAVNI